MTGPFDENPVPSVVSHSHVPLAGFSSNGPDLDYLGVCIRIVAHARILVRLSDTTPDRLSSDQQTVWRLLRDVVAVLEEAEQ